MGSGAFLVQACRWLSDRLVEAWTLAEAAGKTVSVDGEVLEAEAVKEPLPRDSEARTVIARRLIAERCLYGVDLNPLAVELAKLSIWLVTLAKGRPFGFLDHNLRSGDSLLGVHRLDQLTELSMTPTGKGQQRLFGQNIERAVKTAIELRQQIRAMPIRDIRDVEAMARLDAESRQHLDVAQQIADAFIGYVFLSNNNDESLSATISLLAIQAGQLVDGDSEALVAMTQNSSANLSLDLPQGKKRRQPFHWPLEFPEVFQSGGFHGVVGNPPFMGGKRITHAVGQLYREFLVNILAEGRRGNADLCAYFCLRFCSILRVRGITGMLSTKTLSQGETREVCLNHLTNSNFEIVRASKSFKWPGKANLAVSNLWIFQGEWQGNASLDDIAVDGITAMLTPLGAASGEPFRLHANIGKAFQGSNIRGIGFALDFEEASRMIEISHRNKDVLFPFLGGNDILSKPDQEPSRWVINFFDFDEEKASSYIEPFKVAKTLVLPERMKIRDVKKRTALSRDFWKYDSQAKQLYKTINSMGRYLVHPFTGKHNVFQFYEPGITLAHTTTVVALSSWSDFTLLQSSIHWMWALQYGNKLETRPQYAPSSCFDTFPFPEEDAGQLEDAGRRYHESRTKVMRHRKKGATYICNLIDNPQEVSVDIIELRELMSSLDSSVLSSYGWGDIDLEYGFHETQLGIQFAASENARTEILQRLLQLNHDRYKKELSDGLHGELIKQTAEKKRKARNKTTKDNSQPGFDFGRMGE